MDEGLDVVALRNGHLRLNPETDVVIEKTAVKLRLIEKTAVATISKEARRLQTLAELLLDY